MIVATPLGEFEYKLSAIAVKDADTAQTVLTQLKKGTDFAQLAKQRATASAARRSGWRAELDFIQDAADPAGQHTELAAAARRSTAEAAAGRGVEHAGAGWRRILILRASTKNTRRFRQYDQIKRRTAQAAGAGCAAESDRAGTL